MNVAENTDASPPEIVPKAILSQAGICRDCGIRVPMSIWETYDHKCIGCGRCEVSGESESRWK